MRASRARRTATACSSTSSGPPGARNRRGAGRARRASHLIITDSRTVAGRGHPTPGCAMVRAMTLPVIEHLDVEADGRVVTVTVNRPDARNAMTFEMYE